MRKDVNSVDAMMKKLKRMVSKLCSVFEYVDEDYLYIFDVTYEDMKKLEEELLTILKDYKNWLQQYEDGNILLNSGGKISSTKPANGKNAPAYKKEIDEALIKKLNKNGMSLREIARRVKCSPSTVKSRLWSMEHRPESGGKFNLDKGQIKLDKLNMEDLGDINDFGDSF